MRFKIGDTVALKSGGPCMTVGEATAEAVRCCWFEGAELREGAFPEETLRMQSPTRDAP